MNYKMSQVATSFITLMLSFLASSHHWIHMGILLLLGGSTNIMATMSNIIWIRRMMIIMTIITIIFSIYRMIKHSNKESWLVSFTILSVFLSLYFIYATLIDFGW